MKAAAYGLFVYVLRTRFLVVWLFFVLLKCIHVCIKEVTLLYVKAWSCSNVKTLFLLFFLLNYFYQVSVWPEVAINYNNTDYNFLTQSQIYVKSLAVPKYLGRFVE